MVDQPVPKRFGVAQEAVAEAPESVLVPGISAEGVDLMTAGAGPSLGHSAFRLLRCLVGVLEGGSRS
jgi:hypothetical protein